MTESSGGFLEAIMRKMGFAAKWVTWIIGCVSISELLLTS